MARRKRKIYDNFCDRDENNDVYNCNVNNDVKVDNDVKAK